LTRAHASASVALASSAAGDSSTFVAVVIGWVILIGSCFRSLPQILKILKARSVEGLSLTSLVVETCTYTSSMAYNINHRYPLNSWGDSIPCWIQNLVIIGFILRSSSISPLVIAWSVLIFFSTSAALFCGCVPLEVLAWMQVPNIFITSLGVKLPQIYLNWTRGSSGVLSRLTCLLNVLGNGARVYTTIVITADLLLLISVSSQLILNSILLLQTLINRPPKNEEQPPNGQSS
jgi:mannose-P-dolichol utilization defect protein 1